MDKTELNSLSTEELIRLSENDVIRFKDDRYHIYEVAGIKFKELSQMNRYNDMKREYEAFMYPLRYSSKYDSSSVRNSFSNEDIIYYKYRAKKTLNPILKARYCDIIYEYNKKNYRYAYCAIRAHITCSQIYFDNEWDLELADSLKRAISLAYQLKNYNLFLKSAHEHNLIIFQLGNEDRFGVSLLKTIENILNYDKKLKQLSYPINYCLIKQTLEKALNHVEKNNMNFYIQRAFMELFLQFLKQEPEKKVNVMIRIASSYENEGDLIISQTPDNVSKAAYFYQEALNSYKKLPKSSESIKKIKIKKNDELLIKLQKLNKIAINKMDFSQIDCKDILGADYHEKMVQHLEIYKEKEPFEFLQILINDNLYLSPLYAKLLGEAYSKESALQKFLSIQLIHSDLHTKRIPNGEENSEYTSKRIFTSKLMPCGIFLLNMVFELFETENENICNELTGFISACELIDEQRLEIIKQGLRAYEEKQYVAAIHILIFQIEGILRDICEKLGLPTTKYINDNEIRAIMPGAMLKKLSNVGIDKDLLDLINIFLYDTEGYNYRNGVAHGLYDIHAFTKDNAQLLIYILIKLTPYKINPISEN